MHTFETTVVTRSNKINYLLQLDSCLNPHSGMAEGLEWVTPSPASLTPVRIPRTKLSVPNCSTGAVYVSLGSGSGRSGWFPGVNMWIWTLPRSYCCKKILFFWGGFLGGGLVFIKKTWKVKVTRWVFMWCQNPECDNVVAFGCKKPKFRAQIHMLLPKYKKKIWFWLNMFYATSHLFLFQC